jgi:hypothetical protein
VGCRGTATKDLLSHRLPLHRLVANKNLRESCSAPPTIMPAVLTLWLHAKHRLFSDVQSNWLLATKVNFMIVDATVDATSPLWKCRPAAGLQFRIA